MQTNYSAQQLQSLLSKVRIFNSQIGEYQHHTHTTAYEYVIRLDNGTIFLSVDELEADHNRTLTPEILTAISERFQPSQVSIYFREPEASFTLQPGTLLEDRKNRVQSWIILVIIVLAIIAAGVLISRLLNPTATAGQGDTTSLITFTTQALEPKTEAQLLAEMASRERENPTKYLSINWDTSENALLEQVFEGSIYNEAYTTGFMNIRVRISSYNKANYLLDERDYIITEFIDAGKSHSFKWPTEGWSSDISHFEARIIRAECY